MPGWGRGGTRYELKAYARASDKVLSCESTRGLLTLGAHLYASLMLERAFMHARTHAARSACAHTRCTTRRTLMREGAYTRAVSTRKHYSLNHVHVREPRRIFSIPFFSSLFSSPFLTGTRRAILQMLFC